MILVFRRSIRRFQEGILFFLLFYLAGHYTYLATKIFNSMPEEEVAYTAIVTDQPVQKPNSLQVKCDVISYFCSDTNYFISENVLLYLQYDSLKLKKTAIGDSVIFTTYLQKIRNRGNPGEFDYAGYMANERIYYTAYVRSENYRIGLNSGKYKIRRLSGSIQSSIIDRFRDHGIRDNELGVVSALIAGERSEINDALKNNYASAGATHILAVSGLHVGILYLFLSMILFPRNNYFLFRIVRLIIILLAIWFFAFITGLSSSVLRSSVMFSMFLLGKSFNRPVHSYNILAASALIILIFDPLELFKVGFQFSYAAVFGILYFQPSLCRLFIFSNGLTDRIWQLLTVSIAAQISTFPLALFYFHQFPAYFWLTNIIVIPVVWIVMMLSILFFISLPVQFFSAFISKLLNFFLFLLNRSVISISNFPGSVISDIHFELFHLVFFYGFILGLIFTYRFRKKLMVHIVAATVILFLLNDTVTCIYQNYRQELIIYSVREGKAFSIIEGSKHVVFADSALLIPESDFLEYTKDFWISNKIFRNMVFCNLEDTGNSMKTENDAVCITDSPCGKLISYRGSCIMCYNKYEGEFPDTDINYVLIDEKSGYPDGHIIQKLSPCTLVLSPSVPYFLEKKWRTISANNICKIHDMSTDGSLRIIKN